MMSESAVAYLAGILDGEGTITITKHRQHNRSTFQLKPRITVPNTSVVLIDYLQATFGGVVKPIKSRGVRRKPQSLWRVMSQHDVFTLLERARPYLIVKAAQADTMLEFLRNRQQAKGKRAGYSDSELALQERIRKLNAR